MPRLRLRPLLLLTAVAALAAARAGAQGAGERPTLLLQLRGSVQSTLDGMDRDLKAAAGRLSATGVTGEAARAVLADLCRKHPYVVNAATVEPRGRLALIEPAEYRKSEGADISDQEHVRRLKESRKPVLSRTFRAVEGFDAVDLAWPVFSAKEKLIGSVSLLFRPETLLKRAIEPKLAGVPITAVVLETGGRILSSPDPADVGRNLLKEARYQAVPALASLGKQVARQSAGAGACDAPPLRGQVSWATAGLHGTEWRVAVAHPAGAAVAAGSFTPEQQRAGDAALRRLAEEPALLAALTEGRKAEALALLERYHRQHPGVYAVQWLDASAVTRFGYPVENSLVDYDFREARTLGDGRFVQAVKDGRESMFDLLLLEGTVGRFYLVPLRHHGRYLGLLYTIWLKPKPQR